MNIRRWLAGATVAALVVGVGGIATARGSGDATPPGLLESKPELVVSNASDGGSTDRAYAGSSDEGTAEIDEILAEGGQIPVLDEHGNEVGFVDSQALMAPMTPDGVGLDDYGMSAFTYDLKPDEDAIRLQEALA